MPETKNNLPFHINVNFHLLYSLQSRVRNFTSLRGIALTFQGQLSSVESSLTGYKPSLYLLKGLPFLNATHEVHVLNLST